MRSELHGKGRVRKGCVGVDRDRVDVVDVIAHVRVSPRSHPLTCPPRPSNLSCVLHPPQRGLFISGACVRHYLITPLRARQAVDGFSASKTRTPYVSRPS